MGLDEEPIRSIPVSSWAFATRTRAEEYGMLRRAKAEQIDTDTIFGRGGDKMPRLGWLLVPDGRIETSARMKGQLVSTSTQYGKGPALTT